MSRGEGDRQGGSEREQVLRSRGFEIICRSLRGRVCDLAWLYITSTGLVYGFDALYLGGGSERGGRMMSFMIPFDSIQAGHSFFVVSEVVPVQLTGGDG